MSGDFFSNRFFAPAYFSAPFFGARETQPPVEEPAAGSTGVYGLAGVAFGGALRRHKKEEAARNAKQRNVVRGPRGARYRISEDDAATLAAILATL